MKAIERHDPAASRQFSSAPWKDLSGKTNWTQAHFRWLEGLKFEHPIERVVFEAYLYAVKEAQDRVAGLEKELLKASKEWKLAPVVEGVMALRGVSLV